MTKPTPNATSPLPILEAQIAERADALEKDAGNWPCQAGCDHCCRSLSRVPQLSEPEWRQLEQAASAFSQADRKRIGAGLQALASAPEGAGTCPLLDDTTGRCTVYAARPLGCRSYGYYRARAHDAWCTKVEAHVDAREPSRVPFGNQDALERAQQRLPGEVRGLDEWWRDEATLVKAP